MTNTQALKRGLASAARHYEEGRYDDALAVVERLMKDWPGNARLYVLWGRLVQLQDESAHGLDDVKAALRNAADVDPGSPAGPIELGYYLDAVEDDPRAAAKAFSEGVQAARRLLIDGLVGQARALLQLDKRKEAMQCVIEALSLANLAFPPAGKAADTAPDVIIRDPGGPVHAFQLKGPFAARIEEVLHDLLGERPTTT